MHLAGKSVHCLLLTYMLLYLDYRYLFLERQTGSFIHRQYIPVVSVFLNLGFSILLVNKIGVAGVIVGTLFGRLMTYTWNDPSIIFKYHFKKSSRKFIFSLFSEIFVMAALFSVTSWITSLIIHYSFA